MQYIITVTGLIVVVLALNLPMGYLRKNYEKFSFGWYFYVHITIPLIIYLRIKVGVSWHMIPLTLAGAVVGQVIGGRMNRNPGKNG
jgi:hypothetical protein